MTQHNRSYTKRRLRVFDLTTPWFWLVIFYRNEYGEPRLQAEVFTLPGKKFWRFTRPQWEDEPYRGPMMAVPANPTDSMGK